MTFACLIIYIGELNFLWRLEALYRRPGDGPFLSTEEFLSRATLPDIIRYRFHVINSWIMMGLITIFAGGF